MRGIASFMTVSPVSDQWFSRGDNLTVLFLHIYLLSQCLLNTCHVLLVLGWSTDPPSMWKSTSHPQAPLHLGPAPPSSCPNGRWGTVSLFLPLHPDKHHIQSIHSATFTHPVPSPTALVQTTTPCQGAQSSLFSADAICIPPASQSNPFKT